MGGRSDCVTAMVQVQGASLIVQAKHNPRRVFMAIPIGLIIKAVAPIVGEIAKEAIPAFTKKPAAVSDPILVKQIEELQAAATQNAESIQVLAEKLQQVIEGIEASAEAAQKQIATYKMMLIAALGLSGLSLLLSIVLLAR